MKLPLFSGEAKDFPLWWMRFKSYAKVYGVAKSINRIVDPDLPANADDVIDDTTAIGRRQIAAKKANDIALANLTMSFTTEGLMGLVYSSMTTKYPDGLAWKVVNGLFEKYYPQDLLSKVELRQELNSIKMKKEDNPSVLFEALSGIENKYNTAAYKVPSEDLIAAVLEKAPKEYSSLLTAEMRSKGPALTREHLKEAMNQLWRNMYGAGVVASEENEIGLWTNNSKIKCYRCGETGHKAFQCKRPKKGGESSESSKKKFQGKCNTCGKIGHKAVDCFKDPKNVAKVPEWFKKKNTRKEETALMTGDDVEMLLQGTDKIEFPQTLALLLDPNVWVADTGASVDSTGHKMGVQNVRIPSKGDGVTQGNGIKSGVEMIADIKGTVCNKEGLPLQVVKMSDVKIVPDNKFNLFSVTKRQKNGWKLHGDHKSIWLEKAGNVIRFDILIKTKEGTIFAMYLKRTSRSDQEVTGLGTDSTMRLSVIKAHDLLGHTNEDMTRATAKALGWEITRGGMPPCEACSVSKAKQKNVTKTSDHVTATKNAYRMFVDMASIKGQINGPKVNSKRHWRMMVDERTGMKFSSFYRTKDGMIEPTLEQWNKWKQNGLVVKKVRCNNAGENKKLQERAGSKDWKLNIEFEYTARDTPQQNHLVELGFAVITNRGRTLMQRANVPMNMRYQIFPKAFETATLHDGLVVVEIDRTKLTRFEHLFKKIPKFAKHLRTWGEAGTVKTKQKMAPKLENRGDMCMFVGYALDHDGDCYEMLDPVKGTIYVTRDVVWMQRMYYKGKDVEEEGILVPVPGLEDLDREVEQTIELHDNNNGEEEQEGEVNIEEQNADRPQVTTRSGREI